MRMFLCYQLEIRILFCPVFCFSAKDIHQQKSKVGEDYSSIAERLSTRLIILPFMFWIGGLWPQLPSRLGIQLKYPIHKSCVHLRKFIVPSTVAMLAVSLSQHQNEENSDESKEERSRRLVRKRK